MSIEPLRPCWIAAARGCGGRPRSVQPRPAPCMGRQVASDRQHHHHQQHEVRRRCQRCRWLPQSHLLCKTKLARGKFGTRVQSCTHHERLRKLENDSSRPGIAQSPTDASTSWPHYRLSICRPWQPPWTICSTGNCRATRAASSVQKEQFGKTALHTAVVSMGAF